MQTCVTASVRVVSNILLRKSDPESRVLRTLSCIVTSKLDYKSTSKRKWLAPVSFFSRLLSKKVKVETSLEMGLATVASEIAQVSLVKKKKAVPSI